MIHRRRRRARQHGDNRLGLNEPMSRRDLLGTGQGWLYGSLLRDDRNGSLRVRLPDVARTLARDAPRSLAVRDARELRLLLRTAIRPAPGGRGGGGRVGDGPVGTEARRCAYQ